MKAYCDTSFLVSLYAPDDDSPAAAAQAQRASTTLLLTVLGELELANALRLRVFRKELTSRQAQAAYGALERDIAEGVYALQPVSAGMFASAKRLALKHTAEIGSRSLDVLHVAAATVLGAEILLSFDRSQRTLAAAAGLRVAPSMR